MLIQHSQNHSFNQWMVNYFYYILDVANDFYFALNQLYNTNDGCFNINNLNILNTAPIFIFG
jgi:hypothetical protein